MLSKSDNKGIFLDSLVQCVIYTLMEVIFMKKVAYSIVSVVAAFTLIFSGCGEEEVSINAVLDSNDDYTGDRIRVTGEIIGGEVTEIGGVIVRLEEEDQNGRSRISCHFPIDEPPPPYISHGDVVTISGIVKFSSSEGHLLIECRLVE